MGAALLATAWIARRRVANAADTLTRGQGQALLEAARQAVRDTSLARGAARLDSLVAQDADEGLRYVAFVDPAGNVLAAAGTAVGGPLPALDTLARRPPHMTVIGRRVRMTGFAPPPRGASSPPGDSPRRARPRILVIEFEPVVARQLTAQATRTFALAALVAAGLLAMAFVFWRLSIREEHAERQLEQQRRLGMLGEMSAVLAHEIRNPLASLKGHAQLLAERMSADSAARRSADWVVQEAQRLEALTSDLLDFARSGPIDIRPADPAAVLRASAEDVGPGALTLHVSEAPASWPLDAARMRQALTNVMRNARQASPDGTRPEADVRRQNGNLVFTVRDFGAGIPAGDEKRIFSPFYTTRTAGTGLGLAVAQRVAELHGGTITAANHAEGGAVFRVVVPRR